MDFINNFNQAMELAKSESKRKSAFLLQDLLKETPHGHRDRMALQLALTTAESELRQQETENEMLVQQVLSLKARDIERMDLEHEQFRARQQEMMKAELAEAAREQKNVTLAADTTGSSGQGMMAGGDVVPSKAKIKFEAHEGEIMSTKWEFNGNTTDYKLI